MNNKTHKTLAKSFDDAASVILSSLDFELVNDPNSIHSHYGASSAIYKQSDGFYLGIWFNPIDGQCAGINCGRSISFKKELFGLSTSFSELAAQIGISTPKFYTIEKQTSADKLFQLILTDLKKHLPKITTSITLPMLESLENKPWSALGRIKSFYPNSDSDIEISEYISA